MTMSFDDAARQAAETLGTQVGRVVQERIQEFVTQVTDAAAQDRAVVADQAQQALAAAEKSLADAVDKAREDAIQETTERFESALAERDSRFETELAERTQRLDADLAERTQRLEAEHAERTTRLEADVAERGARAESTHAQRTGLLETQLAERSASEGGALERLRTERTTQVAQMERLVKAFRRLDEGQSLSHLLDVLAVQVAHQVARSAIFVVRGQSLQGWAFSGFNGAPLDARSLSVPLDKLPALAEVVRQGGRSEVHTAGFAAADVNPLAFVSLPRAHVGVGVPVLVGGQVAAVVYGDDGTDAEKDSQGPGVWADTLELLARHAARCLEAQTAIRAARLSSSAPPAPVVAQAAPSSAEDAGTNGSAGVAAADAASAGSNAAAAAAAAEAEAEAAYAEEHARRYARLLIADIRLYNEAAVRAGREHRDLWHRLQPDIARARRSFEDRVNDVADRERLFDEELVRTLADGDESLLGYDLGLTRPAPAVVPERLAV
jgi:hypothetical protein